MVRFSIIIPNYNGQNFLEPCITSILAQDFSDYEIILVDNASVDQSVELVRSRFPSVRIAENKENQGYAGGCNDGIAISTGECLLFLNTDTVLAPHFLSSIHEAIQQNPEYGIYTPKILYPDGKVNAAGCLASISGSYWERGIGTTSADQYDQICEVFGPHGAAAFFSRDVLEITGGFDNDFFLFVEETDLTFRARLAGYSCLYVPTAVVYHYHGGTAGRQSDLALYYLHRNVIWYVIKDYPALLLLCAFPWIVGRNILSVVFYLIRGRGSVIIQAKKDAILGLPRILRKRKRVYRKPGKVRFQLRISHLFD